MNVNGIQIRNSRYTILRDIARYFGFIFYNESTAIYCKIEFEKKYKLFGLFNRIKKKRLVYKLGYFANDWSQFVTTHKDNVPLAILVVKKFAEETKQRCDIVINENIGGVIRYNTDDPRVLVIRRQYLEEKLKIGETERQQIEKDLADVYKKLQALEGGGPYRALSAVE